MDWNNIYIAKGSVQTKPLEITKQFISQTNKKGKRLLDLGCGTGRHILYAQKNSDFELFAVDNAEEALEILSSTCNEIKTFNASFDVLPFEDNFFDIIISTKALHHGTLKQIKKYIEEIKRVGKIQHKLHLVVLSHNDFRAKTGVKFGDENTRLHCEDLPDADIPHHFFTKEELQMLVKEYKFSYCKEVQRVAMKGLKPSTYFDVILEHS